MFSDRAPVATILPLAFLLLLNACTVAPLYGTGSPGGGALGKVSIEEVDTRVAQRVREALIRDLGRPRPEAVDLVLDVDNAVELFLTDFESDRASAGTAVVTAAYRLVGADGATLASGRERARASFEAPLQEFARQRAIRDAEDRAAREAAARIRLAIAPALAGLPSPTTPVPERPTGPERDQAGAL